MYDTSHSYKDDAVIIFNYLTFHLYLYAKMYHNEFSFKIHWVLIIASTPLIITKCAEMSRYRNGTKAHESCGV